MFKLDNDFLAEVGLDGLLPEQKTAFLEHVQSELEVRVGERMSQGLTGEQIAEFEKIIDNDAAAIQGVLLKVDNYKNDEVYQLLIERGGFKDDSPELLNEYATIKWLSKNRPDYQQIVADVAAELKKEITDNKSKILGS